MVLFEEVSMCIIASVNPLWVIVSECKRIKWQLCDYWSNTLFRWHFLLCIRVQRTSRPQSTDIPRVPQCLSPRPNWDPPPPLPQASVSPGTKGGGGTLPCEWGGGGGGQFGRLEKKSSTLSTLCSRLYCKSSCLIFLLFTVDHMVLLPDFILYAMKTKSPHIPRDIE